MIAMTAACITFPRMAPETMASSPRKVACHCLNVSTDEIHSAVVITAAQTVKDVIRETGAGSGCTACHCTIRSLLEAAGRSVPCATRNPFVATQDAVAVAG